MMSSVIIIEITLKYTPAVRSNILSKLLCKLCVILQSRVLRVVCPHLRIRLVGDSPCNCSVAVRVNRLMVVSLCAETIKPVSEGDEI